jgi:hypothetical protein
MENVKWQERPKETFNKVRFLDYYMECHKGFIAGGCFKNIHKGEKVKDLDIFFESESDYKEAVIHFDGNDKYVFSYENKNTRAYKNKETSIRVELISSVYGSAIEIINNFDFTITKYAYARKLEADGIVYYNIFSTKFFEDLVAKKLVIDEKIPFPVSTFERSYRYRGYGFGLCKESKGKLIEALQNSKVDDLSNELYFGID